MSNKGRDIVVIGTSAGGLEALDELIGRLPADLPASIFIVQHMSPENTGAALLHRLGRHKAFNCKPLFPCKTGKKQDGFLLYSVAYEPIPSK